MVRSEVASAFPKVVALAAQAGRFGPRLLCAFPAGRVFLGHRERSDPVHRRGGLDRAVAAPVARGRRRGPPGHFSILRQAIAEAGGTEVKNLGDGLMVVFASASAALACGVAMQQGVERDNRDREHSVGLRVGLSGEKSAREDDDYFGDPVVEAARLCATCESGQVLATDVVRAMAGRRNRHECRPSGTDPEGTPRPGRDGRGALGAPRRGRHGPPSPFRAPAVRPRRCCRTRSRDANDDRRRQARRRGRRARGAPHLGRGRSGQDHACGRSGQGRPSTPGPVCCSGTARRTSPPPISSLPRPSATTSPTPPRTNSSPMSRTHGSELARLVPALASRIPDLPPRKPPTPTPSGSCSSPPWWGCWPRCRRTSPSSSSSTTSSGPTRPACSCCAHLTAAEQAMRVLVLGTYRDSELSHPTRCSTPWRHSSTERGHPHRVGRAGRQRGGGILEAAAGQTLDDAGVGLAHAVYRETDGNPFFVSEVLRHLAETGAIYQDATGRWAAEDSLEQMALPDSVREVIGARVGRLGTRCRAGSVDGGGHRPRLRPRSAGESHEDDRGRTARHPRCGQPWLWCANRPTPRGTTTSPTPSSNTPLYEDLGPTRRARAHRQVAEALEDSAGTAPVPGWANWPVTGSGPPSPST